jgi:uracil-DNA glycosylase
VLLLNTVLSVREGAARSHRRMGWETFTDEIIRVVAENPHPVAFMLWGKDAQTKRHLVESPPHTIIESPHPGPQSAPRGFFESRPFSRANEALLAAGRGEVDWRLAV